MKGVRKCFMIENGYNLGFIGMFDLTWGSMKKKEYHSK